MSAAEDGSPAAPSPTDEVMRLITGRWRSQILYAGVKLGTFDALDGPARTAAEVAAERDLDPDHTYRLLRALAAIGLMEEGSDGTFSLTDRGELLTGDHPNSLRGIALWEEGPWHYAAWRHLPRLIRTGEDDAFRDEWGHASFEYGEVDRECGRVLNAGMTGYSRLETEAVLDALGDGTLADVDHLCDVGGGYGHLLSHLVRTHPGLTGEVLELPGVVAEAGELPAEIGVEDRVTFTAGDMFEEVPAADGYVMKHVLHDWEDDECVEILENIRRAASPGAPVLVAEWVIPGPDTPHPSKVFDIHMMVAEGGRERTLEEYGELFEAAGLELSAHHEPGGPRISVVEGRVA